jgi:hypothetical protein
MSNCKDCVHHKLCNDTDLNGGDNNVAEQCEYFKDKSKCCELPYKVGSKVFVSPDNGEHFHKAILCGCNEKGSFIVFVNDYELTEDENHIVKHPLKRVFYDWFAKVYSKEEVEQSLERRSDEE